MKILTVRQPWASLIVAGLKDVENRPWSTKYRGRLGNHAAMRFDQDAIDAYGHLLNDDLPFDALLGSVLLAIASRTHGASGLCPESGTWF